MHGGAAPQVRAAAGRRLQERAATAAVSRYGLPREVDPSQALLEEVHRTAGHVAWLESFIHELKTDELVQVMHGPGGAWNIDASVWLRLYQAERSHLARVAKAACDAGVAERQVRLVEEQAAGIVAVLRGALSDLGVDAGDDNVAAVVSRRLELVAAPGGER